MHISYLCSVLHTDIKMYYLLVDLLFLVSSLNSKSVVKPGDGLLQPEECRQYLYCLSPVYGRGHTNILEATNIGRLDISWRYNLGEKGRLQTSQLQRIVSSSDFSGTVQF